VIIKKISHSRLGTYDQCPFHYRLRYHEKIKSPLEEPPYFEFGHYVHYMFELVVKDKMPLERASVKARAKYGNFDKTYVKRIPNIIANFKRLQDSIYSDQFEKEETELEFKIPIEGENFYFNGFIDRKIDFKNGNILIMDYKTSKKHNQVKKYYIDQDPQLLTYIWATSQLTEAPIDAISGMLFYLESGDKLIANPDSRRVSMHIQECVGKAKEIEKMDPEDAEARVTKLCGWCEYRTICPTYLAS